MVFKNMDMLEAHVPFKVYDPVYVHVEQEQEFLFTETGHCFCVRPVLHDDLMGADISHLIVDPFSPLVLINLYDEYGI